MKVTEKTPIYKLIAFGFYMIMSKNLTRFFLASLVFFSFFAHSGTSPNPDIGEEVQTTRHQLASLALTPPVQDELFPLLAFKLVPPQSSEPKQEVYLVGSIHDFPYEKYPLCLREIIEDGMKGNFSFVAEHETRDKDDDAVPDFILQTEQDEPWSIESLREVHKDILLDARRGKYFEDILKKLSGFTEYKLPYAFLFSHQSEKSDAYADGLEETIEIKFNAPMLYLESAEECLEGIFSFKSFSEFNDLLLRSNYSILLGEGDQDDSNPSYEEDHNDSNLYYPEAFNISSLEENQEKDRSYSNGIFCEEKHIKRNKLWIERLPDILKGTNAIIAVGADHLLSQQGLLCLLQQRGYTLEQLWSNGTYQKFTYRPTY